MVGQNEIDIRVAIIRTRNDLKDINLDIQKASRKGVEAKFSINQLAEAQSQLDRQTAELNKTMGRSPFAGYALSLMFLGQAVKQMSLQVQRFGTKSFNDVMHSVQGTVTQSDYLNASMMYLGFTIGQAFEPVLAFIIPIIDRVAEWVSGNETLTATILAIGLVAGTVFAVGGAAVLGINGFIDLFAKLGLATQDANGAITNTKSLMKSIGGTIAIGFAVASAVDAFKDFSDGEWANGAFNAMSAGLLAAGGYKMMKGKGGGWLIALGIAANLAANDRFFQDTIGLITRVTAATMAIFMWLGAELAKALSEPIANAFATVLEKVAAVFKLAGWDGMARSINAAAAGIRSIGSSVGAVDPTMQEYMNMVMSGSFVRSINDFTRNADASMAGIDTPANTASQSYNGQIYVINLPQGMTTNDPGYNDIMLSELRRRGVVT